MERRKVSGQRALQTYLLTGLLTCGRCGGKLFSATRASRSRRYRCINEAGHRGCGRLTVVAEPLEHLIADAVLLRLDSPELARALAGKAKADKTLAKWSEQLTTARKRLDDLALAYAAGDIDRRQLTLATRPLRDQMEQAERHLTSDSTAGPLRALAGQSGTLRAAWEGLSLNRQHAIIRAVVDQITIAPGTQGARSLDSARVQVRWAV